MPRLLAALLFLALTAPAPELLAVLAAVGTFAAVYGHPGSVQAATLAPSTAASQSAMSRYKGASRV